MDGGEGSHSATKPITDSEASLASPEISSQAPLADISTALVPALNTSWFRSYTLMMVLATVIAVLGLSMDSVAVVIGAMLVAPLMVPVLGIAGALVVGHLRSALELLLVVLASAAGAVTISWLVAAMLPDQLNVLSIEVMARTHPDIRDLGVAFAAGAAGAYIKLQTKWTDSAAGVAVAVALLPPLGVVGLTLSAGRWELAAGGLLLFAANCGAIVLAALVVAFVSGSWLPARSQRVHRRRWWSLVVLVVCLLAIAVPLSKTLDRIVGLERNETLMNAAIDSWISAAGLSKISANIDASSVIVDVAGSSPIPPLDSLVDELTNINEGDPVTVAVRRAETSTARAPQPTGKRKPGSDQTAKDLARTWFTARNLGEVTAVDLTGDLLKIDATGPSTAPPIEELATQISKATGQQINVELNWTQQQNSVPSMVPGPVISATTTWDETVSGVDVIGVHPSPDGYVVDLAATTTPTPEATAQLRQAIRETEGNQDAVVTVRFALLQTLP